MDSDQENSDNANPLSKRQNKTLTLFSLTYSMLLQYFSDLNLL